MIIPKISKVSNYKDKAAKQLFIMCYLMIFSTLS